MTVCQKLGVILESKVVQKLSLEKKVFNNQWSPKLIFLDIFFLKNWLERKILTLFDEFSLLVGIF